MYAFKVVRKRIWSDQMMGPRARFTGAGNDIRDGFIHLSTSRQLKQTLNTKFKGQQGLLLVKVDLKKIEGEVRWEENKHDEELYPHVYGALVPKSIVWSIDLVY